MAQKWEQFAPAKKYRIDVNIKNQHFGDGGNWTQQKVLKRSCIMGIPGFLEPFQKEALILKKLLNDL